MLNSSNTEKVNFIIKIGRAFHRYGANAPRLEAILINISSKFGMRGNFFSTPTFLSVSIDTDQEQIMRSVRVSPGDVDLERLSLVDAIATSVSSGQISIREGSAELDAIEASPSIYSNSLTALAFGATSLGLAIIFNGAFSDYIISFSLGLVVGLLVIISKYSKKIAEIFEFLAAFITTISAYFLKMKYPDFHFHIVVMASLIAIIPGLNLTIAMSELATHNLVSGTARFMGAITDFFKIAFGVVLAVKLGHMWLGEYPLMQTKAISMLWYVPATLIATLSFTVIFKAKMKDFIWLFLSGSVSLGSVKFFGTLFDPVLALFIAGLFVGVGSNIFARLKQRPAMIPLLPGIIFLVPGSIGFKSLNLIYETKYVQGLGGGFQMVMLTMTIVASLFLANVIVNPRRSL